MNKNYIIIRKKEGVRLYLFWDTERVRNTKIYMLGYILTDEKFNLIEQNILIDLSIDLSERNLLKTKVKRLKEKAIKFDKFIEMYSYFQKYLNRFDVISVCYGSDDFMALNDQLKIHKESIINGQYYNPFKSLKGLNIDNLPLQLKLIALKLDLPHDPHNPLSDSDITMKLFKKLINDFAMEGMELLKYPIPNSEKKLEVQKK